MMTRTLHGGPLHGAVGSPALPKGKAFIINTHGKAGRGHLVFQCRMTYPNSMSWEHYMRRFRGIFPAKGDCPNHKSRRPILLLEEDHLNPETSRHSPIAALRMCTAMACWDARVYDNCTDICMRVGRKLDLRAPDCPAPP